MAPISVPKISNPLTLILAFCSVAEASGVGILPLIPESIQLIFVWYLMGFPVLIACLFFLTLNFNRKVLYAPSDYDNQEHFVSLLSNRMKISDSLSVAGEDVATLIKELASQSLPQDPNAPADNQASTNEILSRLEAIDDSLREAHKASQNIQINPSSQSRMGSTYAFSVTGHHLHNDSMREMKDKVKKAILDVLVYHNEYSLHHLGWNIHGAQSDDRTVVCDIFLNRNRRFDSPTAPATVGRAIKDEIKRQLPSFQ